MSVLSSLNSRTKLFSGASIIIVAILVIIFVSYSSMNKMHRSSDKLFETITLTRSLTQLRSDENQLRALTLQAILTKDNARKETTFKEISERLIKSDERILVLEQQLKLYPDLTEIFAGIKMQMKLFRQNRDFQIKLITDGKNDEALAYSVKTQEPLYDKIVMDIFNLEKELDKKVSEIKSDNESITSYNLNEIIIIGFFLILLVLTLLFWIRRMLKRIFNEIKNGVAVLGTSAAEILTTVTEVSTGATETATAVSETTVTMEEIRQTALMAAQKAQSVLENSHRASEAAENGKESVQLAIEGMSRINSQMKVISESVVKLSEQNRSVGEITASVNDIADQSNLLAVNAAIEASKAGEHGRGFTVVAQEIRSLSEQSKKATAQVKEILSEIQKGMNVAVAATEKGLVAVENGNKLARQSGEMIDILAETVNDAAQSVIQISTSSQQQMSGMDQIIPAMENIKQASEQNVIGTRQTQLAAHNLNELGQKLKAIMERFKF